LPADQSTSLFTHLEPPPAPTARPAGPFAAVALEQSIDRELDYAIPPRLVGVLQPGQRVRVPLGKSNRSTLGYVISIRPDSDYPKIKPLLGVDDDRVLVTPSLMKLAQWMCRYYAAPLGVVLDSVIPAAVKKRTGIGYASIVRHLLDPARVQEILEKTKARKRRSVLARLLQLPAGSAIELNRLAGEAGVKPPTVRKLAHLGIISIRSEVDLPGLTREMPENPAEEKQIQLNEDQQKVFDDLSPRVRTAGFSVNLLHGVTGSGKTEIYLQCIAEAVAAGRKALVLVPEIALTPQTVSRFNARFKRVAVLHSGLTATQRHKYWQQIAQGGADVVIGARSAVFAPLPDLGIIVVDEEHDSSYKQDQSPRYHGRDVAIKRAQIENVPVILGSATPSLETYYRSGGAAINARPTNADSFSPSSVPLLVSAGWGGGLVPSPNLPIVSEGRGYPSNAEPQPTSRTFYLPLPNRVRGLAMPAVEIVSMLEERRQRRGVHLISQRLEHLLKTTLASNRQAILLLNRRGYSNFVYCVSCGDALQCKYCDTTMTYHRSAEAHADRATTAAGVHTGQLHCHYCLAVNKLPEVCPTCKKKLSLFGLGTQRVEEELARKLPDLRFARVDSDTMRTSKDYEATLARFATGEIQAMLGTQMIAKGLDYPNVTLVGVISADTALSLPDFRASERTFQLITQVAGRAGRGDFPGRVILQTFVPDDPTIKSALKHDYIGFAARELAARKEVGLPPYTRMARIILRHQDQPALHEISQKLAEKLTQAITDLGSDNTTITMTGPMPCPISRIAGYYRNQIVLKSPTPDPLQKVLKAVRAAGGLAKADEVAVDVDPVSLL
jgi:primosomal protein N' (replication factor Y) (superfamily II helicase)